MIGAAVGVAVAVGLVSIAYTTVGKAPTTTTTTRAFAVVVSIPRQPNLQRFCSIVQQPPSQLVIEVARSKGAAQIVAESFVFDLAAYSPNAIEQDGKELAYAARRAAEGLAFDGATVNRASANILRFARVACR